VLVRHGRTAWNAAGRFQGQSDPPLDATGVTQARRAAASLRRFRPTLVMSSDLERAKAGAQAVAAVCGISTDAVVTDPALREVDLGAWEGLDHDEARRRFPDEYDAWYAGLRGPNAVVGLRGPNAVVGLRGPNAVVGLRGPNAVAGLDVRRGGGETCREAGVRAADTLAAVLGGCGPDATVVAVAHGLVLQAAMAELAARRVVALDGDPPHLGNGAWMELAAVPKVEEPATL
jgi:broad specificity phosphatase PhoE